MKTYQEFGLNVPPNAAGQHRSTCPQCSHLRRKKNVKCLTINTATTQWFCHHCGWFGDLDEGIIREGDAAGKPRQPQRLQPKFIRKPDWRKRAGKIGQQDPLITWFESRGISKATIEKYDIQRKDIYMPQESEIMSAIAFPYYENGEVVNVKYRDSKKNFRQEKAARKTVFGYDDIKGQDIVIITEGEIDKLSLAECGFKNACSVPDGAPDINALSFETKFEFLDAIEGILKEAKTVILAGDNDGPGEKLQEELARRIGKEKCSRVLWPEGCKDANDALRKRGKKAVKQAIETATPFPIAGLITVDMVAEDLHNIYHNGFKPSVSSGWTKVDDKWKPRPGEVTVVTGIPSHGKSEWVDALTVNTAFGEAAWRWSLFSPENFPVARHVVKLIEKVVGKPYRGENRMTEEEAVAAAAQILERYSFLYPDEDLELFSLKDVLRLAKAAVYRYGIKGFVLDPWNDIDHTRHRDMTEQEYIGRSLVEVRTFARQHDVHFTIVAHPTKLKKDKKGNYPIPGPYDISGAANWYNKADNHITVWRDPDSDQPDVEIHITKVKFKEVGKRGHTTLYYQNSCGRYKDYSYEVESGDSEEQEKEEDRQLEVEF